MYFLKQVKIFTQIMVNVIDKIILTTVPAYVLLLLLSNIITHKQRLDNSFTCISLHALQAWLKENPESDDDERGPSKPSKQRKVSYRGGSTVSQNFFYADDGSMKCTLCSSSGFLNKDQLRQHINTHHTGTCFHTLCFTEFYFWMIALLFISKCTIFLVFVFVFWIWEKLLLHKIAFQ